MEGLRGVLGREREKYQHTCDLDSDILRASISAARGMARRTPMVGGGKCCTCNVSHTCFLCSIKFWFFSTTLHALQLKTIGEVYVK